MQKVVISGGLGLLGQRVLRHILSSGCGRVRVMVVDTARFAQTFNTDGLTPTSGGGGGDGLFGELPNVSVVSGDLGSTCVAASIKSFAAADENDCCGSDDVVRQAVTAVPQPPPPSPPSLSVFHLASVMSGQGEVDYDECVRVNVDGTKSLLDTCRQIGGRPRFVFASSIAAFGGGAQVSDETKLLPQTTYGMTKACAELLVNDCTRKGFVDGRVARLPTVVVRPGPPNPAATGCFSSVPKAVLHGQHFVSPVSADLRHPCVGLSSAVHGLIRMHDAPEAVFGDRDRAITLPSASLTLRDLAESASRFARDLGISPGTISFEPDGATEAVVMAMPAAVASSTKALDLRLHPEAGARELVEEYVKGGWLK